MKLKATQCGAAFCAIGIAALTGCGGSDATYNPPPPPSTTVHFSFFVEDILGASADSTPVKVNGVTFDYDVNDDPGAFNYAFVM
jgi:hypothetical protein